MVFRVTALHGHYGKGKSKDHVHYILAKDSVDAMFKARMMPGVKRVLKIHPVFVDRDTPLLVEIPRMGYHKRMRHKAA